MSHATLISNLPKARRAKSQISNHQSLSLILLIFTALTVYQSIILPLGEADDETDHYQYLRFVARTGHPPLTEVERKEAGFKGGLAPLYYWLVAWPIALIGEDTLPDIRRVDARPERHIPTDGLGINHVLHTLDEAWPWRGQVLAWHLVRLLSLPMGWVTIGATYALARRLFPQPRIVAIGATALVAFLPRFVISSAVINDDNLVFALTTLLLLIQVVILQDALSGEKKASPRLFALFGLLLGLTLMTKYFSLILIPEVIFTLVVSWVASRKVAGSRPRADRRPETEDQQFTQHATRFTLQASPLTPLLAFLTALILTAGLWFVFIVFRFNRIAELGLIPGLAASLGEPQITEGLVGLLSGQSVRPVAATYNMPEWFSLLYRSFWFEFGWMQLFAPVWVYSLFSVFLLCALMGHVLRLMSFVLQKTQDARRKTFHVSTIPWLLGLHLVLFIIVVLARYLLSVTIDTGQGRHLYPALPTIAILISLGLTYFGWWIVDFGFRIFPFLATNSLPMLTRFLPARRLRAIGYLLPATCYLLPAIYCLLSPSLTVAHYQTLPVTTMSPDDLPIAYRHTLQFADGLFLVGFNTAQTATAGDTLPVTLFWQAEKEAQQDFLVSSCLQDQDNHSVACWAGHFADGRYPARAWEVGDTLGDTVFIPIPTCYRMTQQSYHLRLEIWPLRSDSSQPVLEDSPTWQQTFTAPSIAIQVTDSLLTNLPQTIDLWRGNQRLTGSTLIERREALTWIDYTNHTQSKAPAFIRQATSSEVWSSLPELDQPLFLPCDDGPGPFAHVAHFIPKPTLPPGPYFPTDTSIPPGLSLSLNLRQRTFAPVSSTLVFTSFLAPLSLEFPEQPAISFLEEWNAKRGRMEENLNLPTFQSFDFAQDKPSNLPTLQPSSLLPITIRWQARRWMAEPLVVALKLLDKDFQVGGERLATLGDRYPNVLWAPGEVVEETYPVQLKPDAPPGLYRLELSLLHLDKNLPNGYENLPLAKAETILGNNLYPATFRLLDPADGTLPPYPFSAQLGDSIHLTGYDLSQSLIFNYQSPISLALYWRSTAKIPTDYTVFTQLLDQGGQVWAQQDNPPQAGRYPTTAWAEQDSVVDRYTLTLPEDAPSGQYRLLVGMYNPITGQRLPATINGQPQADNAIQLTTLTIDY